MDDRYLVHGRGTRHRSMVATSGRALRRGRHRLRTFASAEESTELRAMVVLDRLPALRSPAPTARRISESHVLSVRPSPILGSITNLHHDAGTRTRRRRRSNDRGAVRPPCSKEPWGGDVERGLVAGVLLSRHEATRPARRRQVPTHRHRCPRRRARSAQRHRRRSVRSDLRHAGERPALRWNLGAGQR